MSWSLIIVTTLLIDSCKLKSFLCIVCSIRSLTETRNVWIYDICSYQSQSWLTNWITLLPIQLLVIDVITLRWFIHNSSYSPSRNTWGCQAQNWIFFFTVMDHKKLWVMQIFLFWKNSGEQSTSSTNKKNFLSMWSQYNLNSITTK